MLLYADPLSVSQQADCHVGGQYLASSGQTIFSVAQELALQPTDIIKFNEDLNPIYKLPAGSILIVPLPRSKCSSYQMFDTQIEPQMDDLQRSLMSSSSFVGACSQQK